MLPARARTEPQTYAEALAARLADELGDSVVAEAVVAGIDAPTFSEYEKQVPISGLGETPVLDYTPDRVPVEDVDSLVVFSFGDRASEDGTVSGGLVNRELADAVASFVEEFPVPVYAQWEVADSLDNMSVADVESIAPLTKRTDLASRLASVNG